jgi:hypothetical protein
MSPGLKNIPLRVFREFLESKGLKHTRTTGGHEVWTRKDLSRPVIIQTHNDPVPEFIINRNLHTIGSDRNEFIEFLKNG